MMDVNGNGVILIAASTYSFFFFCDTNMYFCLCIWCRQGRISLHFLRSDSLGFFFS